MTVVFVLGFVAVAAAVLVGAAWRRDADERHSMRDYHQALETLRHVSDRTSDRRPGPSPERIPDPIPERRPKGHRQRSQERSRRRSPDRSRRRTSSAPTPSYVAVRGPRSRPDDAERRARLAFEEHGPEASPAVPSPAVSEIASRRGVYSKPAQAEGTAPRQNRTLFVAASVVVVAAVIASALLVAGPRSSHKPPRSAAAASHSATASGRRAASSTTTAPPQLQPATSTSATAAYAAPASAYMVQLSASGPCWVLASETATGQVLWMGLLDPGQTKQIPATGSLFLRLGAAYDVTVSLDGEPVILPAGHQSPFDVTFQSA
jgi:RodZ C-terminal domain